VVVNRLAHSRFDVVAAVVGLLIAMVLFPLRFFASQIYIQTIPLVLGTASGLYLLGRYESSDSRGRFPTLPAGVSRALPSVVFTGAAGLVLVALYSGGRTVLFYDVAGVLGTLVFAQIVFDDDEELDRNLLLLEILVLAAVVRFAALYTNPGFIGIDIWTHVPRLADNILTERSLSAISDDKHYSAPFYHLSVVGNSLLYGSSLRTALYLSLALVMPFAVLLVYGTANLFVEERWALLAGLLYAVADYAIEWSLHVIPTSHGLLLFLGVLYVLTRMMRVEFRTRDLVLLLVLSVGVILTHQVSTFIMLVLLASTLAARLLVKYGPFGPTPLDPQPFGVRQSVNIAGLLVFDAGFTLFMWSFTPYAGADKPFLALILSYLAETLRSSAGLLNLVGGSSASAGGASGGGQTFVSTVALYLDTTGFLLLLFGTFLGCLYVVNRRHAIQPTFTLLIASAVMLVFVLGLPLFGINNFVPQRWIAFLYAPMAVLTVIGLRNLERSLGRRLFVALVVVLALVYPSAMMMSSNGAIDNPVFEGERERLSYTQQEVTAVETIGRMTGSPDRDDLTARQVLYTDHPYQTMFTRTRNYPADPAILNESRPMDHDIVVYRGYQSDGASYFLTREGGEGRIEDVPPRALCQPSMGTVYVNGDVRMCSTP
jgi:uncharacterized membrane protein